ncbi:MAG: hypothetical protein KAI99_20445 [Cyclobacteriaceae bacterium]|nr:hypothetical protein [Cyclobacteriaceae bacterium]
MGKLVVDLMEEDQASLKRIPYSDIPLKHRGWGNITDQWLYSLEKDKSRYIPG